MHTTTMEPIAHPIEIQLDTIGSPEIVSVCYDVQELRIILHFEDNSGRDVEVVFSSLVGFRVLDEGDLLEFWPKCSSKVTWFYEVESGGWRTLEATRSGFISGNFSDVKEYLVAGINDCVSVLARERPTIRKAAI